jgi:hypothetical protein
VVKIFPMNSRNKKIKYTEIALVIFVWLVLLITPVLFREDYQNPVWRSINNQLEILVPLSALFLINRFLLVPRLLFKGKQVTFILSVLGTIILFTFGSFTYDKNIKKIRQRQSSQSSDQALMLQEPPPRDTDRFRNPPGPQQPQPRPIPPFANFLILSVLFVGFDTGLHSGLRWIEVENEKVKLEKENVATQLLSLRNQVSPHFFMNTLNNIHALVDINTIEAKDAIIKLSKMMRYLLYETDKTTLKKEIEFIESYINLMKLRFSDKVSIVQNLPKSVPDKEIPPLLFISLIENAFKHGISYKDDSFINIDLVAGEDMLLLVVKNRKAEKRKVEEFTGLGIENTRKRLELLYGNKYHLDIIDANDIFTVNLSIPL